MIRTVLILPARPDAVDEVMAIYRAQDILRYSLDNSRALASEISAASDGSGDVLVTALWPDEAAYQEWIDFPGRTNARGELTALLRGGDIGHGRLFVIDHDVTATRNDEI